MPRLEQSVLVNREAQTSDTYLYRKNLPLAGKYSAIDIGIRITNGSTGTGELDPLDVIKHIGLVMNGNDYRIWLSAQEMFRIHWLKNGRPMPYTFSQKGSDVQEMWFRMQFGRFLGDTMFGLDLSKFQNVQVQLDYDLPGVWGAAGVTTFTTATFTITIIAHQFPYASGPTFRGMFGMREFFTSTTAASGDEVQDLPVANSIMALDIVALEDAVAAASHITDVKIGKDNFSTIWCNDKWYNKQDRQLDALDVREEYFKLYASNAGTKDTHMENIKTATVRARAGTLAVA